jgi:hypothetical protein
LVCNWISILSWRWGGSQAHHRHGCKRSLRCNSLLLLGFQMSMESSSYWIACRASCSSSNSIMAYFENGGMKMSSRSVASITTLTKVCLTRQRGQSRVGVR